MAIHEYQNGEEKQKQQAPQDSAEPTKLVDTSRRSFTKSGLVASGVLLTLASRPVLGSGSYSYGGGGYGDGGGKVCKSPSGFVSGNLSQHGKPQGGGGHTCDYWKSHCSSYDWKGCDRSKPFCDEFGFSHNKNSKHGCRITYYNYDSQHHSYTKCDGGSAKKYDRDDSSNLYVPYTCLDVLSRCHAGHVATGTKSDCDVTLQKDRYGKITGVKNNCYSSSSGLDLSQCRTIDTTDDWDRLAQHCMKALLNCRADLTPFLKEGTVKAMFNECRTKGYFEPTAGVHWSHSQCVDYLKSTEDCTYYS